MNDRDGNPHPETLSPPAPAQAPIRQLAPDVTLGGSPFPPIADDGFLSDCKAVALVAPSGNVEWMCLSQVDSPSVFGGMLDRDAGSFRIGPAGVAVPASRRYLPGTMVLETSWFTAGSSCATPLLIGDWHHEAEPSHTHQRAPTDYDADHVLLRTVRCVNGEVEVVVDCEPVFDYSEHPPPQSFEEAHGRLVWTAHHRQHWRMHVIRADEQLALAVSPGADWR